MNKGFSPPPVSTKPQSLVLVDGHNIAYRSFHAIRDLSRRDGHPTNATFGFIRTVEAIRNQWHPTHWCVLFDGGLPEARLADLPEYKANRPPMPELLRPQLSDMQAYLDVSRIPWLRVEGQEADDLIATAASAARSSAMVHIVSSDKDLSQLCDEKISMIPPSDLARPQGPVEIEKRTGVPPSKIADWLALTGDTSDNISGVPGIGPKTAAQILHLFPDLDAVWSHLAQLPVSDRIRTLLAEHRDTVERNRRLTALHCDLPLPADWKTWACVPRPAAARPWLESMEFHSMARAAGTLELF